MNVCILQITVSLNGRDLCKIRFEEGLLIVCGGKERHLLIPSDKCITADIGTGIWADGPKMNSGKMYCFSHIKKHLIN